jgi:hypothetical protein
VKVCGEWRVWTRFFLRSLRPRKRFSHTPYPPYSPLSPKREIIIIIRGIRRVRAGIAGAGAGNLSGGLWRVMEGRDEKDWICQNE